MNLRDREPRKLYYYSQMLGVSETTVAGDMEALGDWFARNHLEVIRRPGYGVILSGSEGDYREAMRRFIHENRSRRGGKGSNSSALGSADLPPAKDIRKKSSRHPAEHLRQRNLPWLNNDILARVYDVLVGMDDPGLRQLADNAPTGLAIHIAIAIDRVQQGAVVLPAKGWRT